MNVHIWIWGTREILLDKSTRRSRCDSLQGNTGNRTQDDMIRNQELWLLDHVADHQIHMNSCHYKCSLVESSFSFKWKTSRDVLKCYFYINVCPLEILPHVDSSSLFKGKNYLISSLACCEESLKWIHTIFTSASKFEDKMASRGISAHNNFLQNWCCRFKVITRRHRRPDKQ